MLNGIDGAIAVSYFSYKGDHFVSPPNLMNAINGRAIQEDTRSEETSDPCSRRVRSDVRLELFDSTKYGTSMQESQRLS